MKKPVLFVVAFCVFVIAISTLTRCGKSDSSNGPSVPGSVNGMKF